MLCPLRNWGFIIQNCWGFSAILGRSKTSKGWSVHPGALVGVWSVQYWLRCCERESFKGSFHRNQIDLRVAYLGLIYIPLHPCLHIWGFSYHWYKLEIPTLEAESLGEDWGERWPKWGSFDASAKGCFGLGVFPPFCPRFLGWLEILTRLPALFRMENVYTLMMMMMMMMLDFF